MGKAGQFQGNSPAFSQGCCENGNALVPGSDNRNFSENAMYYPYVTELKGFITWDVLFKAKVCLLVGSFIYKGDGESTAKALSPWREV